MNNNITIGNCFIQYDGYVYLYGSNNGVLYNGFVTRITNNNFINGNWSSLMVYTINLTWEYYYDINTIPNTIFSPLPLTSAITFNSKFNIWIIIIASSFISTNIMVRYSSNLIEWSDEQVIYKVPSSLSVIANSMWYAPNFHNEFNDNDSEFVWSYNTNSFNVTDLVSDLNLYYPRFIKTTINIIQSPTAQPSLSVLAQEQRKISHIIIPVVVCGAILWLALGLRYYLLNKKKSENNATNSLQLMDQNETKNPVLVRID